MDKPDTGMAEPCAELGVRLQTLYWHVTPFGELRPDGKKALTGRKKPAHSPFTIVQNAVECANLEALSTPATLFRRKALGDLFCGPYA